jgi:hypothetical protein
LLLGIAVIVLAANAPYLLHVFVANPIGPRSGLTGPGVAGILGGLPTIDPNIGFVSQALGHLAAEDWLHGQLPWWNPYEGAGTALAGEMQSAALFPPTLLLALSDGQVYERILFELVAGFATYVLLRRLELRRVACFAGAVAFALNGTFAWLDNAAANPVAFLPLLLLGIESAYAASGARRRGGWWLIALAVALSIYAGFPETAYADGLLAAGWFIWRAACARRAELRAFVLKGLAGALTGGLLAAPIIVAFTDFLRVGDTGSFNLTAGPHLASQALPALVLPYVYGSIFQFNDPAGVAGTFWGGTGGYVGMSLVLFGAVGLFSRGRLGLRITLGVWLALALSRMYGEPPGLGRILAVLPGMSSVVFYRYATPAVAMAAAVLLALGINALAELPSRGRRAVAYGAAGLAIVTAAALAAHGLTGKLVGLGGSPEDYFTLASAAGAVVVLVGVTCTLLRGNRLRTGIACGLVLLETLALFMLPELSAPQVVRTDFTPVSYLRAHVGLARIVTLGPLQPNYGSYFGLATINGNDLPIPKAWAGYVHTQLDPSIDPLIFDGVRNAATRPGELPYEEFFAHLDAYRAAGVAYVLIPSYLRLAAKDPHRFTRVFASPAAAVYRLAGAAPYFSASAGACQIGSERRQAVNLTCAGPSVLTRLETDVSGWTARVDGRPTAIHQVSRVFQSVELGPGAHHVAFSYSPPYIRWAIAGFLAGLVWLLLGARRVRPRWLDSVLRRRRGKAPQERGTRA